jgi:DNA ligase-1
LVNLSFQSQAKKKDLIKSLLVACKESEATYIVRSLQGKLRIGLAEKTVIAALAHAVVLSAENYRGGAISSTLEAKMNKANETIRSVYAEVPNYDVIIPILLKDGIEELPKKCFLTPGIPVHPMLAQPTKGISEVLDRFQGMTFTSEFKYDGERAQIHYNNGKINIYSRNLEDHTGKYPDIIQNLPKVSFVLHEMYGEVVLDIQQIEKRKPLALLYLLNIPIQSIILYY